MVLKFTLLAICLIFTVNTIRIHIQEIIYAIQNYNKHKLHITFWFWCIITILLWTSYIVLI